MSAEALGIQMASAWGHFYPRDSAQLNYLSECLQGAHFPLLPRLPSQIQISTAPLEMRKFPYWDDKD